MATCSAVPDSRGGFGDVQCSTRISASLGHYGAELNDMRAKTLLAEVHALLGYGASALQYANEVKPYFLARKTEDWELAYIHVIHAHAAAIAGDSQLHRQSYDAAVPAIDAIADDEDRKIVLQTFEQVPRP